MESQAIREIVSKAAPTVKSIWGNGVGFDWRGIEYHFNGRDWSALDRKDKIGHGATPQEAKDNRK